MGACKDLRQFLRKLEDEGELIRIKQEVDPKFEIASYIRVAEESENMALLFEKVKGYDMEVVANLYGSIKRCAMGLGLSANSFEIENYSKEPRGSMGGTGGVFINSFTHTKEERALSVIMQSKIREMEEEASGGKYPFEICPEAPCQEVVKKGNIDILKTLPVPWFCEKDGGPYINPGVAIMRDPDTGILNVGGYRHMVLQERYGKGAMGVHINNNNDGYRILQKHMEQGDRYVDIAICVGPCPAVNLMGWYNSRGLFSRQPWSEYNTAGAFMREPLKLVKCKTVDIEVPIDTEVVIEGRIPIGKFIEEGPMAEYTEMYAVHRPNPYIEVSAITHRKNAVFHVLLSGRSLEHSTGGLFTVWGFIDFYRDQIKKIFPSVNELALAAGSHAFHLIISLKQRFPGEDRQLLHYLIGTTTPFKYITIVDADVNPYNTEEVEWAKAMWTGKPGDVVLFPKIRSFDVDPMKDNVGQVTKVGILATRPYGESYKKCNPPLDILGKVQKRFKKELFQKS